MVERNANTEHRTVDDGKAVEVRTITTEKYTPQEFCDYWARLRMHAEQLTMQISTGEQQLAALKKQKEAVMAQINELNQLHEECKARVRADGGRA